MEWHCSAQGIEQGKPIRALNLFPFAKPWNIQAKFTAISCRRSKKLMFAHSLYEVQCTRNQTRDLMSDSSHHFIHPLS